MLSLETRRVLVLGGTHEGAELARRLAGTEFADIEAITSLAGRLELATLLPGRVRTGGFGGAAGLKRYLANQQIAFVIDATHPFATTISAHAAEACAGEGVALLRIDRPAWNIPPGTRWIAVDSMDDAAGALEGLGRRPFLTVGRRGLEAFARLEGVRFLVRLLAAPAEPLPLIDYEVVVARPPHSLGSERRLMEAHRIDVLVTKESGGEATASKIEAARARDIPVVAVRRPPMRNREAVAGVDAALAWLRERL
ncbi:MAG: cobalt-precorrin-6A reductase [Rhodospirillales bacterium]|jgi:precorrin-6A/cobalt-precorrin-6A reductase|nr:cobalt-precorrin-6A reductase [Rhodospirillales bacterium]